MSTNGKVRVVVRSRQVPARTVEFTAYPVGSFYSRGVTRRAVVFEPVLDDGQRKAVEEGGRVAHSLGLELEVVDQSKLGFLRRALSSLKGNGSGGVRMVVSPRPPRARPGSPRPVFKRS